MLIRSASILTGSVSGGRQPAGSPDHSLSPGAVALDKALTNADKVVKRTVDATADEIASELQEALKG